MCYPPVKLWEENKAHICFFQNVLQQKAEKTADGILKHENCKIWTYHTKHLSIQRTLFAQSFRSLLSVKSMSAPKPPSPELSSKTFSEKMLLAVLFKKVFQLPFCFQSSSLKCILWNLFCTVLATKIPFSFSGLRMRLVDGLKVF